MRACIFQRDIRARLSGAWRQDRKVWVNEFVVSIQSMFSQVSVLPPFDDLPKTYMSCSLPYALTVGCLPPEVRETCDTGTAGWWPSPGWANIPTNMPCTSGLKSRCLSPAPGKANGSI